MCAKCFTVIFYGLFYIIAVCEMGWNSLYLRVRREQSSPNISTYSLNAICLGFEKRSSYVLISWNLHFACLDSVRTVFFITVQIQSSDSGLHRSHCMHRPRWAMAGLTQPSQPSSWSIAFTILPLELHFILPITYPPRSQELSLVSTPPPSE